MSKIKYNQEKYTTMSENVDASEEKVIEAMNLWGEEFDNLYASFIESGFLESLYKDAESQYYDLANAGYVVTDTISGVAMGALIGSAIVPGAGTVIGAIIGGLAGLAQGIFLDTTKNPKDVNWHYESKDAFEALLTACIYGEDDGYINMVNLKTKLDSVAISLVEIQSKIDEYNAIYADLAESAKRMNLKTKLADDGVTMLGIETSVTIDGKKVDMTMSDAMNAFYTYAGTVVSSEIQAQYMADTYGVDIDYMDLVNNANGFMVKTIESDLYSHEFVDAILPYYENDPDLAKQVVSGGLGVTTDKFDSILTNTMDAASIAGLGLGLLGATFIGNVGSALNNNQSPTGGNNYSGSSGNNQGGGYSSYPNNDGTSNNDNGSNNAPQGTIKDEEKVKGKEPIEDDELFEDDEDIEDDELLEEDDELLEEEEELEEVEDFNQEEVNDSDIIDIKEFDSSTLNLMEEFELPEIDYDELARIEYEARGEEVIAEERILAITNANALFDNTDKTALIMNLKNFGYDDSEIEVIITNRDYTITAFVEGSQRQALANIANQLAAKDGVADFDTIYDDGQTLADLENGNSDELVSVMNSDPTVSAAQTKVLDSQRTYKESYEKMKESYEEAEKMKQRLSEIKAEIVSNSGDDPKEWTKAEATRYNTAIEEYNKKVEEVEMNIKATKEAKDTYQENLEEYDVAKAAFFKQTIEEQQKQEQEIVGIGGSPTNEPTPAPEQNQEYGEGREVTAEDLSGLVVGEDGIKFE